MVANTISKLSFTLILLAASASLAQVPAGPLLWLRADSGVNIVSGNVVRWNDMSGNHNDAVQADSIQGPSLITNGLNGLPAVHFNGGNLLAAPSIFPQYHDYSVSGVIRLSDTTLISNVISGNLRAIWFNSTSHLQVHHVTFATDAIASAPVNPNGSCFTVIYNAELSTVRLYIDGRMSDSLWIQSNYDSTIFIGAFEQGYFMHGDISELFLYDRELSPSEEKDIDGYMEAKYGLAVRPPPPPPDTTFSLIPAQYQFFPRNAEDSASFQIAGTMRAPGFDSIYVELLRNDTLIQRNSSPLRYTDGGAPFLFENSIHAELSEYSIEVAATRQGGQDSILRTRDSIVCGDAYLVAGQSNAFIGFQNQDTVYEYCRTFGVEYNPDPNDTQWSVAISRWPGYYNCTCAWSYQIAQCIIDSLRLPVCFIDGGIPGAYIQQFLRNDSNPLDVNTAYGQMLYRTEKAGLKNSIRAILWDQGEWNTDTDYYNNFSALRSAWLQDYPSVEKIYVVQIRPDGCGDTNDQRPLRELQRNFQDSFPNLVGYSISALPQFDGCHFGDSGYRVWGTQMYRMIARDLYRSTDTIDVASLNIRSAFYTTPAHDQIELIFDPPNDHIVLTPDSTVNFEYRRLIDFFYLDDTSGAVLSDSVAGNKLFLSVSNSSAKTLNYLPDKYYPCCGVYNGPWIVNKRGVAAFVWYHVPISDQPPSSVNTNEAAVQEAEIVPNPTTGEFSIDASQFEGPIEATLMSVTGAEVLRKSIPSDHPNVLTFDIENESSGCYLLRLSNSSGNTSSKVILEK